MSNLQGLIRKNITNSLIQFEKLGYNSTNFANINTTGYKSVSFDEIMTAEGSTETVVRTNTAQGAYEKTGNPLNVCIKGAGYIPVTSKEGNIYYTRDGNFKLDNKGTLITSAGDIVGSGINIESGSYRIEIKKDGGVYTYATSTSKGEYKGTIPVVLFNNPEGLKEVGGNRYEKTADSGEAVLQKDHDKIAQWGIERSNVDIFGEVENAMRINAQMLAQTTLIKAIDKLYENAINMRE